MKKKQRVEIQVNQTVSEFGDGTFLSLAWTMSSDSGYIYIADAQNSRVVVLDTQFAFIRSIGKKGSGPGEFQSVEHVKVLNNYIYVYDSSLRRMSVFSKYGEFVKIIMPKVSPGLLTPATFDKSGRILLAAPQNLKPIVLLSDSGTLIKEFGQQLPDYDGKIYPLRNARFVFSTSEHIIALCTSLPFIEKYDQEGNLLARKDLSLEYEGIRKSFLELEKKYRSLDENDKSRTVYNLFTDADLNLNERRLYAALSLKKEINGEEMSIREILEIDLDSLQIKKVIVPLDEEKRNMSFKSMIKSGGAFYLGSDEIYKMYYEE